MSSGVIYALTLMTVCHSNAHHLLLATVLHAKLSLTTLFLPLAVSIALSINLICYSEHNCDLHLHQRSFDFIVLHVGLRAMLQILVHIVLGYRVIAIKIRHC